MPKIALLAGIATAALSLFLFAPRLTKAANSAGVALTGQVSSDKEGAMEGVVVGAKKDGSTITIDVVSDKDGHYSFPSSKIGPGLYSLKIRAVGYEMDAPATPPQYIELKAAEAKEAINIDLVPLDCPGDRARARGATCDRRGDRAGMPA